jgi:hypothetical protein
VPRPSIVSSVLMLIGTLYAGALPAYMAYRAIIEGPVPVKRVEVRYFGMVDPFMDLYKVRDTISLCIKANDVQQSNIEIEQATLVNKSASPITPTDYFEKLSLNVAPPFRILSVVNHSLESSAWIPLTWHKVDDRKFEADSALLNPGDSVWVNVYLTKVDLAPGDTWTTTDSNPSKLQWNGRITNLREFTPELSVFDKEAESQKLFPVFVFLSGGALIFTILSFFVTFSTYLLLLSKYRPLLSNLSFSVPAILVASFLSLSASEAAATYLFGSLMTDSTGVSNWLNAPWLLLNAVALIALAWISQTQAVLAGNRRTFW